MHDLIKRWYSHQSGSFMKCCTIESLAPLRKTVIWMWSSFLLSFRYWLKACIIRKLESERDEERPVVLMCWQLWMNLANERKWGKRHRERSPTRMINYVLRVTEISYKIIEYRVNEFQSEVDSKSRTSVETSRCTVKSQQKYESYKLEYDTLNQKGAPEKPAASKVCQNTRRTPDTMNNSWYPNTKLWPIRCIQAI